MDGPHFDHLTRSLAGTASRRGFLGGLLGFGAGLVGLASVQAACPPGQVSRRGSCSCKRTARPPVDGTCPCPRGQVDHGDGLGCLACRSHADCLPSDACTEYACVGGACVRSVTVCPNDNLCRVVACDPALGCISTPVPANEPGGCPAGSVCCGDGAGTPLGTADNCTACGDACAAVDACTPASCAAGACNAISSCAADESCGGDGQCATVCAALGEACSRPDGGNQGSCCSGLTCWDNFKGPAFAKCVSECSRPGEVCDGGRCCEFPGDTDYCEGGSGIICPV